MINFEKLDALDYLRSGAIIIAFLATAFADKKGESKIWLKADAIATCAYGVGLYLFPNIILDYQVDVKSDYLLEHVMRTTGAVMIGMSIVWYYCYTSNDRAVSAAWMLMRIVAGISTLVLLCSTMENAKEHKQYKFKDQIYTFGMLGVGLLTLGNLIHLFQEDNLGSIRREGFRSDKLSKAIIIDVCLVGTACLCSLAYPSYIFETVKFKGVTLNPLHMHFNKLTYVHVFAARIFLLMAMNFNNEDDKRSFFKAYLWSLLLIVPWMAFAKYSGKYELAFCDLMVVKICAVVAVLNAMRAVGCFKFLPECCSWCNCCSLNFFKGK